ncbi:hypothetical protein FHL15_008321 [Xylaria flabelliformis]|uniref:Uncharacterized protein n=1 Tax=Xylaria flabelliformis TaxID=2512241 RepID=A0A553HS11_9PEZI|nr:hypothetical protein FHL15_008321 [Xylaria flabelliformis]
MLYCCGEDGCLREISFLQDHIQLTRGQEASEIGEIGNAPPQLLYALAGRRLNRVGLSQGKSTGTVIVLRLTKRDGSTYGFKVHKAVTYTNPLLNKPLLPARPQNASTYKGSGT